MTREEAAQLLWRVAYDKHGLDDNPMRQREAADIVVTALRGHEWVRTADRLPEPWVTVLLWDGDEMASGYADDVGFLIDRRGLVFRATHWMLPEPPGEEVEG